MSCEITGQVCSCICSWGKRQGVGNKLSTFLWGGHGGREEEVVKSVSNVLLSRLLRSVLKMWVFLKFSAWSIFVKV